jgi:hypothetical protein
MVQNRWRSSRHFGGILGQWVGVKMNRNRVGEEPIQNRVQARRVENSWSAQKRQMTDKLGRGVRDKEGRVRVMGYSVGGLV